MWILLSFLLPIQGFYLPGVAPRDFKEGEQIELYVDKLDSSETQLPFEFYYLNYCKPDNLKPQSENLGQILMGERIERSPYEVKMQEEVTCKELCSRTNTRQEIKNFKWMIDNEYRASWVLDNLPSGFRRTIIEGTSKGAKFSFYQNGFPIGFKKDNEYYVNNHVNIIVQIHETTEQGEDSTWRVVGFLVEPLSLQNSNGQLACDLNAFKTFSNFGGLEEKLLSPEDGSNKNFETMLSDISPQILGREITYTYSVKFEESANKWASRWDYYLYNSGENEVHWLAIINSFAMVLFLTGMVAHIMNRSIRRDVIQYNEAVEDVENETGWKQIRGDVFRPPSYSGLFSILVGTGVQLIGMTVLTIIFACFGFLSPTHRGALLSAMLFLFVFMGIFAGYVSGRLYRSFGGEYWKRNALGTGLLFPGLCFSVFFFINLFIWGEESSGAVPFLFLLEILVMWFGISLPLVFLGASLGYKKPGLENPCRVNKIPKPLTENSMGSKFKGICLMAGSLPFGCMFIELSYVMKSLWHHTLFYYLFGFLLLCFIVLVVTSGQVSILMSYILLCREDYRWWWVSLGVSGCSGVYLFGYSVVYFLTELNLTRVSSLVLYFGYMFLGSCAFALVTGTIGFLATFTFIRTIYTLIKID